MKRTSETLNKQKIKQFFDEETHLEVHEIDARENEVRVIADVKHGRDPDEMREEHGIKNFNRGEFGASYEDLHWMFFESGEYDGDIPPR